MQKRDGHPSNDISKYGSAGIIFVSSDDPYSRLIQSISKSEYSAIGFYAPSTSTGVLKIIVTLVDLFGVEKPTWLNSGCTLDRLIQSPLVTRLAIRPLSIQSDTSRFRSCICRGVEMMKKLSLEEVILSLFGCRDKESPCATGIDLVNRVITLYGQIDKIHPGGVSLSALDDLQRSPLSDRLGIIGMMGLPFSYDQERVDISSYIVDTELFGSLIEIPLPIHHPDKVASEQNRVLQLYRPYLTERISTFLDLILTRPDFVTCVSKLLQEGRRISTEAEQMLLDHLRSTQETSTQVLSLLETLQDVDLEKINQVKKRLQQDNFTTSLYLQNPSLDENRSDDLRSLQTWMEDLIDQSRNTSAKCQGIKVDMAQLLPIVNRLTKANLSCPNVSKTPSLLIWSKSASSPSRYHLKSGRVIYLDPRNPDLESLSTDELIQISSHLNHLDETYDRLREVIASHLSWRHQISSI